ncbi:hypothetical protein GOBAR_AA07187 [Gossypium barbadense]|uniref:NAD(P)H-hydrate epimerase n=1 Tax=Gossypium barbadense TaxID=3634 RepID=A0A2P5YCT1_GOSBA|nr:hypothetical protein GOBAR_AA07187 [Gossypium barbadense]
MESSVQNPASISYLTQREAAEVDETLMGPLGFSVDQLMELAGLSVATSIAEVYQPSEYNCVLAICGPGTMEVTGWLLLVICITLGISPLCVILSEPPLYSGLVAQLESLSVSFLSEDELPADLSEDFDILVDAMFGFSFRGIPIMKVERHVSYLKTLMHHFFFYWDGLHQQVACNGQQGLEMAQCSKHHDKFLATVMMDFKVFTVDNHQKKYALFCNHGGLTLPLNWSVLVFIFLICP